jgi:hypothetical protein
MKRGAATDTVEFTLGPHAARQGWEVARITYDASNASHLAQVEAAITAMVKARGAAPVRPLRQRLMDEAGRVAQ